MDMVTIASKPEPILIHQAQFSFVRAHHLTIGEHEIEWLGFVYMDGVSSGEPSIRKFVEEIGSNLGSVAAKLKGIYFIAIREKATNRAFAFVDSSALYHAYYSPHYVGTSFLDIVALENLHTEDLDPEAVVEFVQFGCIYSGRTLFSQIRKLDPDMIVESRADGRTATLKKAIPDISDPPGRDFEQVLRSLAESIRNENVSLDLTGGIDSRLLAVSLAYFGLPFELAASGTPGIEDLQIAQEVAGVLDRNFFTTRHAPASTDWKDLFSLSDGLFDLGKSDRPIQLQRDRAARGVTLAVSGAGGELFKDFWWLQDFPFYKRREANLERLYAMRFAPGKPKLEIFSQQYRPIVAGTRNRVLRAMSNCAVASNTKTYDRIYYELKMREFAGRFLTNSSAVLRVHAPYLEREAAAIGYNLDRSKRFFNRYHRASITKMAPQVAKIATTEGGMTASAAISDVSRDLIKYVFDRASRLKRKLNQRRGATVRPSQGPDSADLPLVLSQFARARNTIQRLQDHGVVSKSMRPDQIPSASLGSLLSLDMLIERLESKSRPTFDSKLFIQQPA